MLDFAAERAHLQAMPVAPPRPLIDPFGRRIDYLRISVTDRCDFRCVYCMPEAMTFLPRAEVLSLEEIDRLASAFVARGTRKLRLTGGEPLVRRGVVDLVRSLARHLGHGLDELTMTTNGSQLARFASDLAAAGMRRVNVSLDTLDPDRFARITRWGRLPQVLEGIAAAQAAGLHVKINMVALKGVNDDEIEAMLRWTAAEGHDLVLIETMPLGMVDEDRVDRYVPLSAVRRDLEQRWTLTDLPELDRRAGTLCAGGGDRAAARLHHAAHAQLLRELQPRPPDGDGAAVSLSWPGRRAGLPRRPARGHRRRRARRDARPRPARQTQGSRLRHRPSARTRGRPPHEPDRRVTRPSC